MTRLLAGLLLMVGSLPALGQDTVVVHERPVHARHFAGTVVDAKGMWVEYATVELRSPKDHHLLASTYADGNGRFAFDDKKYGKVIEVRVMRKGFAATQYTVVRKPFGGTP